MPTKKPKAYRSKITLKTADGLSTHIVTLSGPETAVKEVCRYIVMGLEAQGAGFKLGDIAKIAAQAEKRIVTLN